MAQSPYNVTPPGEYQEDTTLSYLTEQVPSFGQFTNLAAGADAFYGAMANNVKNLSAGFQKALDWEIKQAEIKRENDRRKDKNIADAMTPGTLTAELLKLIREQIEALNKLQLPSYPGIIDVPEVEPLP
jgi:hypothetical protein